MFNIFKRSFIITTSNHIIPLFFVLYMIIFTLILQKTVLSSNMIIANIIFFGLFLFSAAFFAGWFEMVKQAILNNNKGFADEVERIKSSIALRKNFFEGITKYILPLAGGIFLYYVIFLVIIYLDIIVAEKFFGKIDFLANDLKIITQSNEAMVAYFKALPNEKLLKLFSWEVLFLVTSGIYSVLTLFWVSALYFNKKETKNPLMAYAYSFEALFKKPFAVIFFNIIIALMLFIYTQLAPLTVLNPILSFLYMVAGIYFFVFLTVLIFNYYARNFGNISDNGGDCLGEDKTCNQDSKCE